MTLSLLPNLLLAFSAALLADCQRTNYGGLAYDINAAYCAKLPSGSRCCTGRLDDCSTPISTTRCYCDEFCNQHGPNRDCCPDYEATCKPGPDPEPIEGEKCLYAGRVLKVGEQVRLRDNCYVCTCTRISSYAHVEMRCEYNCRITPTIKPTPDYECYYPKTRTYYRRGDTIREDCKTCTCRENYWGKMEMSCYPETCQHIIDDTTRCIFNSQHFNLGFRIRTNGRECTCQMTQYNRAEFVCDDNPDPFDIYDRINRGNYGWKTYRYPFLIGKSLDEVYRQRTGVCRPGTMAINQNISALRSHYQLIRLQDSFDARTHWPVKIHPISDQRDQPISWAISTAELASDRMVIHTNGRETPTLSAQHLVACVSQPKTHCSSTTAGWEYANKYGILTEDCFPRTTGLYMSQQGQCHLLKSEYRDTVTCPFTQGSGKLHRLPKHYKLSTDERFIQAEIMTNGPVQAHIRVKDDFFYYHSGVYWNVAGRLESSSDDHFLAVRIIGWGVDHSEGKATKYWLCANSWGTQWGENGYFRIKRGENQCDVEAYVYGVWSQGGTSYYDGFIGGP